MTRNDDEPGGWFGPSWGAPVCADRPHLPTPVGEECLGCDKVIVHGDQGMTFASLGADLDKLRSMHLDCLLQWVGLAPQ